MKKNLPWVFGLCAALCLSVACGGSSESGSGGSGAIRAAQGEVVDRVVVVARVDRLPEKAALRLRATVEVRAEGVPPAA